MGEEYDPTCTKPTVKEGGDSVMVWGVTSKKWTGSILRIKGIMDQTVYVDIFDNTLLYFANDKLSAE